MKTKYAEQLMLYAGFSHVTDWPLVQTADLSSVVGAISNGTEVSCRQLHAFVDECLLTSAREDLEEKQLLIAAVVTLELFARCNDVSRFPLSMATALRAIVSGIRSASPAEAGIIADACGAAARSPLVKKHDPPGAALAELFTMWFCDYCGIACAANKNIDMLITTIVDEQGVDVLRLWKSAMELGESQEASSDSSSPWLLDLVERLENAEADDSD